MHFPPAGRDVPVTVAMQRLDGPGPAREVWLRDFGGHRFRSYLRARRGGGVTERFGPLRFDIGLRLAGGRLCYPVTGWRCLGVPMPRALMPRSDTFEYVDGQGRACFDVAISLPLAGLVVGYRGWLLPAED